MASSLSSSSTLVTFSLIFCLVAVSVKHGDAVGNPAAMYVFGDSLVDVGNNNHLKFTLLKADYPFNGVDYPGHKATGRFSNGKNAADFLAEKVGLSSPVPYLSVSSSTSNQTNAFLSSLNFASAGAGILDSTHSGECVPFNKQIEYFSTVYGFLVQQLGTGPARSHLSKSIFNIVIGSNDIFAYPSSSSTTTSTLQQYVDSLMPPLRSQLMGIYNLGARKFAFIGTGPVGCCPAQRQLNKTGSCNVVTNTLSVEYNKGVISLLEEMKAELRHMSYSFFDTSTAMLEVINNPAAYGFAEVKQACCGLGIHAKLACLPISTYCSNRKNHLFWDSYHPTETAADLLISTAVDGSPPFVYPINVKQLVAI